MTDLFPVCSCHQYTHLSLLITHPLSGDAGKSLLMLAGSRVLYAMHEGGGRGLSAVRLSWSLSIATFSGGECLSVVCT